MARHKRVSVQGKGADLFFGDLQPAAESDLARANEEHPDDTSARPPITTSEGNDPAATDDGMPESKHAINGTDTDRGGAELISSVILDAVWRDLAEQATVTNAFRYTHEELGQLTDVIYELGKAHGTRVTKQEVARLGLNAILTDYHIRGAESLLSTFIARRSDLER